MIFNMKFICAHIFTLFTVLLLSRYATLAQNVQKVHTFAHVLKNDICAHKNSSAY